MLDTALLTLLRCVGCRSGGLLDHGSVLECPGCGRTYPVQAEVPVMISDTAAERGPLLDPECARHVLAALGAPADPLAMLRVRRASGARVRLHGGAGGALPEDGRVLAELGQAAAPAPAASGGQPRCEWLGEYIPRAMTPGVELLANVRFRNAGDGAMPAAGDGRVTVACEWASAAGACLAEDVRTPLPAELAPGRMLTLPVRIGTPGLPGRYTLLLRMAQEGVRWLEPVLGPLSIQVRDGAGFAPPAHWVLDGGVPDRDGARDRAMALMHTWLARYLPPAPRVLELGNGARPAAASLQGIINVDADLLALQFGRLGANVHAACADPANLPFPDACFDAAICFGSLHATPDPALVLRRLRAHLRPGGFIALFCEPVGQMWPGAPTPAALGQLRRGGNPQGFSLAEFALIFQAAGLRAAELSMNGASLQARLEPEGGDA